MELARAQAEQAARAAEMEQEPESPASSSPAGDEDTP
jgi:hypothetical protein